MAFMNSSTAGPSGDHRAAPQKVQIEAPDREGTLPIEDPDTCRICRGESTVADRLYFPCKCSGTIKYVHQDCLMEWLSHSRKKYCELCKTHFRFTKLYDPHMPKELPLFVFIRKAISQTTSYVILWCRAALVVCVWLFCLPYCMRSMWRTLFWVGDGEWASHMKISIQDAVYATQRSRSANFTSLSTIHQVNATINSTVPIYGPLNYQIDLFVRYLRALRFRIKSPVVLLLFNKLFSGSTFDRETSVQVASRNNTLPLLSSQPSLPPSLLSEVGFFRSLSSWPILNKLAIDVVEGQIITLLVVLAFTLIFLIREWVVQQQPILNIGDADIVDDDIRPPALEAELIEGERRAAVHERVHGPESSDNNTIAGNADDAQSENSQVAMERNRSKQLERANNSEQSDTKAQIKVMGTISQLNLDLYWLTRINEKIRTLPVEAKILLSGRHANSVTEQISNLTLEEKSQLYAELKTFRSLLETAHGAGEANANGNSSAPFGFMHRAYFSREEQEDLRRNNPQTNANARIDEKLKTIAKLREDLIFFISNIGDSLEHVLLFVDSLIYSVARYQELGHPEYGESPTDDVRATNVTLGQSSPFDTNAESGNKDKGKGKVSAGLEDIETDVVGIAATSKFDSPTKPVPGPGRTYLGSPPKQTNTSALGYADDNKAESNDIEERRSTTPEGSNSTSMTSMSSSTFVQHRDIDGLDVSSRDGLDKSEATAEQKESWLGWVMNCFWGDVIPVQSNETLSEHVEGGEGETQRVAAEVVEVNNHVEADNETEGDREAEVDIVAQPEMNAEPNQQEVQDDGEDLEGLLELIGAHGPITGLFQNAVVSAILVTSAITCAVWFPYLWGKVFLVFLGNPVTLLVKLPIRVLLAASDLIADFSLVIGGSIIYWIAQFALFSLEPLNSILLLSRFYAQINAFVDAPKAVALSALRRLSEEFATIFVSPNADMLFLSTNAHIALRNVEKILSSNIKSATGFVCSTCRDLTHCSIQDVLKGAFVGSYRVANFTLRYSRNLPADLASFLRSLLAFDLLSLNPSKSKTSLETDFEGPEWTATDRLLVILTGYGFFAVLGALYLKYGKLLSSSTNGRKVERVLSDILQQAGGVMKVILIISIEMIVFPLYCGLLLDIALLPLFEGATIESRVIFTLDSPWKAGFVHWFVGTCYMYHFALFVSMCRKMMRTGVLYFIRDPDDPNFHPVRDVLERSVTTQLRKITFSAVVYGAMIIVSLGGVIWTLYRFSNNLFPIRWTTEPLFEFSIDILLYCFLTPFLLKYVHVQELIRIMFGWWFRRSARSLRLSHFLFGKRQLDEEGYYINTQHEPTIVREDTNGSPSNDVNKMGRNDSKNENGNFQRTGRFVCAPATDQVRIPKGSQIFVELDGVDQLAPELFEAGNDNGSNGDAMAMKTMVVYIPPNFGARIILFICSIWLFAAGLGLIVTVIPLITGRYIFSAVTANSTSTNDIYAYSLGMYTFGGMFLIGKMVKMVSHSVTVQGLASRMNIHRGIHHLKTSTNRIASLLYVYGILSLISFFLLSLLIEIYILVPLHTIYSPGESHTIHIIQNLTIGFLYGRIITHYLFQNPDSQPSRIFRAVTGSNYVHPDIWLATRCFALPAALAFNVALVLPYLLSLLATSTIFAGREDRIKIMVHRMAYPAILLAIFSVWFCFALKRAVGRWRTRIRDEVYLVGERLHNYGERKARPGPPAKFVKR